MQKRIVTLTMEPSLDLSGHIDKLQPEDHLECDHVELYPGGGGINISRAIHNLQGESEAYYVSGGYTGIQLEYLLNKTGLRHHPMKIKSEIRHSFAVLETEKNEQYRFGLSRMKLDGEEIKVCLESLFALTPKPDYLILSSGLPEGVAPDFYAKINTFFKQSETKIVVDVPTMNDLKPLINQGFYMLKPNSEELDALNNSPLKNLDEKIAFAKSLRKRHSIEIILLSLGQDGVFLITETLCENICIPNINVVSTVGAGDSLVAGTVLALSRGESLQNAVRYGVAASASTVQKTGSQLCDVTETNQFFKELLP